MRPANLRKRDEATFLRDGERDRTDPVPMTATRRGLSSSGAATIFDRIEPETKKLLSPLFRVSPTTEHVSPLDRSYSATGDEIPRHEQRRSRDGAAPRAFAPAH